MAGAVAAPTHIAADPDCSYRLAIKEGST